MFISLPKPCEIILPSIVCAAALGSLTPALASQEGSGEVIKRFHFEEGISGGNGGLGHSVAGLGDVNGDGVPDILLGAPFLSTLGMNENGAVMIYSGANGSLLRQFDGQQNRSDFGKSVAALGDLDGDGVCDLGISAPEMNNPVGADGTVYVHSGATGALLAEVSNFSRCKSVVPCGDLDADGTPDFLINQSFNPVNVDAISGRTFLRLHNWAQFSVDFGYSVAGAGDVDGDGHDDVIIGARSESSGGLTRNGGAYIYSGATGGQLHHFQGNQNDDYWGESVSGGADFDGDGLPEVLIGSSRTSSKGMSRNGAFAILSPMSGTILGFIHGIKPSSSLGSGSLAVIPDADGDGVCDILAGAHYVDVPGTAEIGAAYLWSGATLSLLHEFLGYEFRGYFGHSVSGAGDLDGDGLEDLLIGSGIEHGSSGFGDVGAYVYSFRPLLKQSTSTISAAVGGILTLDLDFPLSAASTPYRVLVSARGTGPIHQGVDIPLSADHWFRQSVAEVYPFLSHTGMGGNLDGQAQAQATISFGPGELPISLVGRTLWFCAVSKTDRRRKAAFSSVPRPVTIEP